MNPPLAMSIVFVIAFLVSCLLIVSGRPSWLATRARQNPFYPWRAWDWNEMPPNWQHHRIWSLVWSLLFGCVAVAVVARGGPRVWAVGLVSVLICLHFLWVFIRITAKHRSLSHRG